MVFQPRMLHSPRHAASGAETQPRQRVVRKNLNIIAASNDRTGKWDVSPALAWRLALGGVGPNF